MNERAYSPRYSLEYPLEPLKPTNYGKKPSITFSYPANPDTSLLSSDAAQKFANDDIFSRIGAQMSEHRRLAGIEKLENFNRFFPLLSSQINANPETIDEEYLINKLEQTRLDSEMHEVDHVIKEGTKANVPYATLLDNTIRFAFAC